MVHRRPSRRLARLHSTPPRAIHQLTAALVTPALNCCAALIGRSASVPFRLSLSAYVKSEGRKDRFAFLTNQTALPQERKRAQKGATQMDVYAIVTEKIISLLEQGVVPWVRREVA